MVVCNAHATIPQVTSDARAQLVEWMTRVSRRCNLKQDTLFLGVNIVDRFLAFTPLSTDCLQLLGVVAIFIATKQVRKLSRNHLKKIMLTDEKKINSF